MSFKTAIGKNIFEGLSSSSLSKWDEASFHSFDKNVN